MWAPNWGRLFIEWRCKAIWVPFSEKELEAIKSWVDAKDIQTWKWKWDEKEVEVVVWDEKEVKKQLKQTLRDRGIEFTNFDSLEKLQEKLQEKLKANL